MTVGIKALRGAFVSAWPLVVVATAGWTVLRWYLSRMTDGSDEPFGLVALGASLWFTWREPRRPISGRRMVLAMFCLAVLALTPAGTPPLVRALLWIAAVAALMARSFARAGLLVYSLPVMASAQFFAGYPVRVAVTWATSAVLRLFGLAVTPSATVLVWHRERVLIDAPCSGLQMAWLAGLLGLLLANFYSLRGKPTFGLLAFAAAVTFGANVARAALLFLLETQLRVSAEWMHDLVGLSLFAFVVAVVVARASSARERARQNEGARAEASGEDGTLRRIDSIAGNFWRKISSSTGRLGARGHLAIGLAFGFSAAVVAARPLCERGPPLSQDSREPAFPGWEAAPIFHVASHRGTQRGAETHSLAERVDYSSFDEAPSEQWALHPIPLDAKTRRFAADFPGKLALFSDGERTWIVRWVFRPTRKLHPASDCLRAAGYRVVPGRAWLDGANALWSSFDAKRDGEDLRVRERIVGSQGAAWSDVSAWFWATFFDSDSGPWWAITEVEAVPLSAGSS